MRFVRLRKNRINQRIRDLSSETRISAGDLVMPYFVIEGKHKVKPIKSMPGISRLSIDNLVRDIKEAGRSGVRSVLLFGVCDKKDKFGLEAYSETGIVQRAVAAVKKNIKDITVITDVCLCGYTSHGHCGILKAQGDIIDNDKTLEILAKIAFSHAEAGADFVAPSAMMDGQVKAIREVLDRNNFKAVKIFAYSAKYASNFYWPFRDAMGSSPRFGDRKDHQMDFRNSDEALKEISEDIKEGASVVMVKPALAYLDIISRARQAFNVPIAAYNVSGEYALLKNYSQNRESEKKLVLEILTGIKRAGSDIIITYHAKEAARWLK
ncbi:MAG: porphobilinogen synthase [Candidatus Omnitrophota bacterium]|nr:porphobilinogen synthase [Candidatus Omnitrophota bacterium]